MSRQCLHPPEAEVELALVLKAVAEARPGFEL